MDTMTNKLENELKQWKAKDAAHNRRRAEIMYLLYSDGYSMKVIGKMYGDKSRQFVQQEIKRHLEQQAT